MLLARQAARLATQRPLLRQAPRAGTRAMAAGPQPLALVYVTAPDKAVATSIARSVVEQRLAACVNVVPQVQSIYRWEGAIETSEEVLLVIKTRQALVEELTRSVQALHPYGCCEVLATPVVGGSQTYMSWVRESTERGQ